MRKDKAIFRDAGLGGSEFGKIRSMTGSTRGTCSNCNHRQQVSKNAWFRASKPKCNNCGGFLHPSKSAEEKLKERRTGVEGSGIIKKPEG